MLRFLTAGESHGEALAGILEGFPKGIRISRAFIDKELARRQSGYGRGRRMSIEKDKVKVLSGLRAGVSLGSPIAFVVRNKDKTIDCFSKDKLKAITTPRPGHADLAGYLKYDEKDIRNILERSSARETACRVVVGALCKQFLTRYRIEVLSHTLSLGKVSLERQPLTIKKIRNKTKGSRLNCIDPKKEALMIKEIDKASKAGDTLGGVIEIIAEGLPSGLGSFMHWDRRLDTRLAQALMSIPAIKGVEIGLGFDYARALGSKSHDAFYHSPKEGFYTLTNNSGGILGGISTGAPLVMRIAMKPIATLKSPLDSVDIASKKPKKAPAIRSDVTAVPACGVVAEAMVAFVLADSLLDRSS